MIAGLDRRNGVVVSSSTDKWIEIFYPYSVGWMRPVEYKFSLLAA